ncbi:MAG: VWA domain-containing protein, partial [archaeon]|nr:VWA domain-containing protein [archaeon]
MGIVRSEDLVILLDSSRSMFRKETSFKDMSRIRTGIRIIKEIIKKKKINDPTDRYSFVTFNGVIKQINEMFFNELKIMDFIRSDVEFASGTSLGEALAAALKLIIAEMRKIGEKVIRILVIGDGISVMSAMNPINLAK